jgi:glycosyltransferase involved in cell wall biosynthesis
MEAPPGIIVIGRNEGARLRQCLASVQSHGCPVVYVDSASTDGSVALARSMQVEVIELDRSSPFTAARARNAGFDRLRSIHPEAAWVQFIDGDCELSAGWLPRAQRFLAEHPQAAVAWGRRRERYPERSIYNTLCDIEWNVPVGQTTWCGGDTLMRASALCEAGGFNPTLIAGEEPELCLRLRNKGWTIHRIAADVTLHDANMLHATQWCRRAARTGYAFAEGAHMYRGQPQRYCVRDARSVFAWGLMLPMISVLLAWPTRGLSLLAAVMLYGLLAIHVYRQMDRSDLQHRSTAMMYALFTALGKIPQAIGLIQFHLRRATGRQAKLIEYKHAGVAP